MFSVISSRQGAAGLILAASALYPLAPVQAGESRVELTDGSVISGELLSIDGGRYRLRSATLGEVILPESSIRALRPGAESSDPGAPDRRADEIADIQKRLVQDPGLMDGITALQNDPEIQAVLADPELTRLILAGDIERLRADPRIQRLMSHPALRAMVGRAMGP
ncbi:hypothetical protein [Thiocystis violacea]|uniref:hypothetical protein n=1 Tax=Thiocystis violacea TaxID=13725 RepID=UPI0019080DD3|nr:hypothetical protein [Thiocystis violacea]MBK1717380.1 hypothetical protein [Thiocystis violacea]